jgi:hypothetical protein
LVLALAGCADAEAGSGLDLLAGGDGLVSGGPGNTGDAGAMGESDSGVSSASNDGGAPSLDLPAGAEEGEAPCESELFNWEPIRPQLVFVLDHSGSMSTQIPGPLGGSWSRWQALHEVVRLTLERRQSEVEFGLKLFPTPALAETDGCAVTAGVEVSPMVDAMDELMQVMPSADGTPVGATPIFAGLQAAGEALLVADTTRPRALLLVADGGISATCGELENTLDAATYLAELRQVEGVDSFVVGVGEAAMQDEGLETLAWAGGQGQVFESEDGTQLDAAIGEVVDSLRVCDIQLASPFPDAMELSLLVDGEEVESTGECAAGIGYSYDPGTGRLALCEATCIQYFEGSDLEVERFCPAD